MARLSKFVIGMIIVSFLASVIALFMTNLVDNYAEPTDFNKTNESLAAYNKMSSLSSTTENIQNRTIGIKENPDFTDKVGLFVGQAFDTLKIGFGSFDLFSSITDQAASDAALGQGTSITRITLTMIVLVAILFLFISALIKWRM